MRIDALHPVEPEKAACLAYGGDGFRRNEARVTQQSKLCKRSSASGQ
jgi:hypothetical protein